MEIGQTLKLPSQCGEVIYIYGLYDPADGVIRYVGKTPYPATRLESHYLAGRKSLSRQRGSEVEKWLATLLEQGRLPEMKILDLADRHNWNETERRWIEKLHAEQKNLVNSDTKFQARTLGRKLASGHPNANTVESTPDITKRIKEHRKSKGLSQHAFGGQLGVDGSTVSLWEAGKRRIPKSVLLLLEIE